MNLENIRNTIVGMDVSTAQKAVEKFGIKHIRTIKLNGEEQQSSMDFLTDRINVEVKHDKIVDITNIG